MAEPFGALAGLTLVFVMAGFIKGVIGMLAQLSDLPLRMTVTSESDKVIEFPRVDMNHYASRLGVR